MSRVGQAGLVSPDSGVKGTRLARRDFEGVKNPNRKSAARAREPLAIVWARVVLGLALAATAGVAFGQAWENQRASMWGLGVVALATGVVLIVTGLRPRRPVLPLEPEQEKPERPRAAEERLMPMLGALLVYKFQWISERQLAAALEKQRKTKQRLGEMLVQEGLITEVQLRKALEYQRSAAGGR